MSTLTNRATERKDLRALLAGDPVLMPGGASPLEAVIAEKAGFEAFYVSGYAVAALQHALPDVGIIGRGEMTDTIRRISAATTLPIIADADTGYGEAPGIARTVHEYEDAGVSAVQIEDQVWPKRCGHMAGKEVVSRDKAVGRIRAAVKAKAPDTVIVGRSDALAVHGIDEAIERCRMFADEGAELLFVDAPRVREDFERITSSLAGTPLMVNISEGGLTPQLEFDEFAELGFQIIFYPSTSVRVLATATHELYTYLKANGTTAGFERPQWGLEDMNATLGLDDVLRMGAED